MNYILIYWNKNRIVIRHSSCKTETLNPDLICLLYTCRLSSNMHISGAGCFQIGWITFGEYDEVVLIWADRVTKNSKNIFKSRHLY